jgi:hypothetical protein
LARACDFIENEIFFMGDNKNAESGIGNEDEINEIIKINYFEKENCIRTQKIKKITCGEWFSIFLTGIFIIFKIKYYK